MYPIGCEVILTSRQCPVPSRSMTGAGSALGGEETSGGGAGAGEAAGAAAAAVVVVESPNYQPKNTLSPDLYLYYS